MFYFSRFLRYAGKILEFFHYLIRKSSGMFVFSKKLFVKLIKAPLRVENTLKNSRFCGLTEQRIRGIFEDEKEWKKLTQLARGKFFMGVVPYLTGILVLFCSFLIVGYKE